MRLRAQHMLYAKLLATVRDRPMHVRELADHLELDRETVRHYLIALHSFRLVHVSDWHVPATGVKARIYAFGEGEDAPEPPPSGRAARNARYRAKHAARIKHMQQQYNAQRRAQTAHKNKRSAEIGPRVASVFKLGEHA